MTTYTWRDRVIAHEHEDGGYCLFVKLRNARWRMVCSTSSIDVIVSQFVNFVVDHT